MTQSGGRSIFCLIGKKNARRARESISISLPKRLKWCDGVLAKLLLIDINDNLFDFQGGIVAGHVEFPSWRGLNLS